jgi:hypothetical protein
MVHPDWQARCLHALAIAMETGGIDGGHHKAWVIDQMVRALLGCPTITVERHDFDGHPFRYQILGESPEYLEWVQMYETGEDGPGTYEWDRGITP